MTGGNGKCTNTLHALGRFEPETGLRPRAP